MPISRFKCQRCGLEATRIGSEQHYVPSVEADEWARLCVMAVAAIESGEAATPMIVNCPYLRGAASVDDNVDASLSPRR